MFLLEVDEPVVFDAQTFFCGTLQPRLSFRSAIMAGTTLPLEVPHGSKPMRLLGSCADLIEDCRVPVARPVNQYGVLCKANAPSLLFSDDYEPGHGQAVTVFLPVV